MMRKFTTFILFLLGFVILPNTSPAQNTDVLLLKQINHAAPGLKPTSFVLTESAVYISLAAPVAIAGYGLISSDQDLLKDACTLLWQQVLMWLLPMFSNVYSIVRVGR